MQTLGLLVTFALTGVGVLICIRQSLAARRWQTDERPVMLEPDYSAVVIPDAQDIGPAVKDSIHGLDAIAHHAVPAVEQALHGLHMS
jgi:hypothetical protein